MYILTNIPDINIELGHPQIYLMNLNKYIHDFYSILVKHEILCLKVEVDYHKYFEFVVPEVLFEKSWP